MRLVCSILLLLGFAGILGATTIVLSGNQDPTCSSGYICITNDAFSFSVNSVGGGYTKLINGESLPITSLSLDIPYYNQNCPNAVNTVNVIFDDAFFSLFAMNNLTYSVNTTCEAGNPGVADFMLNASFDPGIGPGYIFNIGLNDDPNSVDTSGTGGWVQNAVSNDTSSTGAPEPGTFVIAASGLLVAGLGCKRRYWTSFRKAGSLASDLRSVSPAASLRE